MTQKKLRITGANGGAYQLGQPMFVHDAGVLLGTLDPVPVGNAGTEIHVEHFTPTRVVREEQRHVGRLVFLEVCEFIAENFHQVQAISFAFAREVSMLGGGAQQAIARAQTMARIVAINVQVAPKPNAMPGFFSVSGVWAYSEQNLAALRVVLHEERALYRDRPIAAKAVDKPGVRAALRRLVPRRDGA
jgi:sugar (pentulose or hexulose) kinase